MAAAKKVPAKKAVAQQEWSAKTIGEFKVAGTAAVWRSQVSTAPDGRKFAGVRKYFVKKDGTERADRAGFAVLVDPEDRAATGKALAQIGNLLQELSMKFTTSQKTGSPGKVMLRGRLQDSPSDSNFYALHHGNNNFLVKCVKNPDTGKVAVKTSTDAANAKQFATEELAQAYLDGKPRSLKGFEISSLT